MMHFILPIRIVIFPPLSYLGLVVFVAGIVLNVSAMGHLRRNLTTVAFGERSGVLATDGPYRISRNPIYLSGIILLLGPAIFLGSLITFVFLVILFLLLDRFYIPEEEIQLKEELGVKYMRYKRIVWRWL